MRETYFDKLEDKRKVQGLCTPSQLELFEENREDAICKSALQKMQKKYILGVKEHGGVGMEKSKVPLIDWLQMLQEEHMDSVFYCEKIITLLKEKGKTKHAY